MLLAWLFASNPLHSCLVARVLLPQFELNHVRATCVRNWWFAFAVADAEPNHPVRSECQPVPSDAD
eukprot:3990673-Alexandrium_andersonii.AAC.1